MILLSSILVGLVSVGCGAEDPSSLSEQEQQEELSSVSSGRCVVTLPPGTLPGPSAHGTETGHCAKHDPVTLQCSVVTSASCVKGRKTIGAQYDVECKADIDSNSCN
jgi:hypothetical protein